MADIVSENKKDVAIYEIVAEKPTKLRIRKAIFVLKRDLNQSPEDIIKISEAWADLIDFEKTLLLNATKLKKDAPYKKINYKNRVIQQNQNKYAQYYSVNIYKSIITEIYHAYTDKLETSDTESHYLSNTEIDLILQKHYKNNSEATLRNKRTAYIIILQSSGYLKAKDNARSNNIYKFIKKPEWIPEVNSAEIQNRRLIELKTMRES